MERDRRSEDDTSGEDSLYHSPNNSGFMKASSKEAKKTAQRPKVNYYERFNIREGEITKDKKGIALKKTG